MTEKKIILFGAGKAGQIALHYFGAEKICCFVDNYKNGKQMYGKDVISFDELCSIHENYLIVICANYKVADALKNQCYAHNIPFAVFDKLVTLDDYDSVPGIRQFQNVHSHKRCFLIGNGSSLRSEDLDILAENNEFSFGCNNIHKIFHNTAWRPDYYFAADSIMIFLQYSEIAMLEAKVKFIQNPSQIQYDVSGKIALAFKNGYGQTHFFNRLVVCSGDNVVPFSEDPSKAMYTTATVMYPMLQMAVYMGFREIYLLGVDNTLTQNHRNNHFYPDDMPAIERYLSIHGYLDISVNEDIVSRCYEYAREYCSKRQVRVLNTTRGGNLETFERIGFDSLF